MKKTSVIMLHILIVAMFASMLLGCSKTNSEVKPGLYMVEGSFSNLTLEDDKTFVFVRSIATDYIPVGNYAIDGDNLLLYVNEDEKQVIKFKINANKLIFQSGVLTENLIEKGTEFILQDK